MHRLSAIELHNAFCKKELSAESIIDTFLQRIDLYDKNIGAFLNVLKDRAREKAQELDKKHSQGKPLGKLAGIPIAIKDNIHIKNVPTSCASEFLKDYHAVFDSTVVRFLEEEDAIIIGKTNLDEFAMGSSTENSALQKTCNPWNLNYVPGGSSGGSASAVAARMCPISLGSDTGGSIRQPAAFCGTVGFKPTYGRVSRYGLVAFASSFDQIGPIANTTSDIALIMEVIGKHCRQDSTSIDAPKEEYLSKLRKDIRGFKVAVPRQVIEELSEEPKHNFHLTLETLEDLGCKLIDIEMPMLKYAIAVYQILTTAEASTNLARFDGIRYGMRSKKAKTLAEIYHFSKQEGFGQEVKRRILLGTYVLSSGYQDAYYKKAQKVRSLIIEEFDNIFKQCDFIAMPVTPTPAFKINAIKNPLDLYRSDAYTIPANLAGLPAISIPSGFSTEKTPFGLQLLAPQLQDASLCHIAHAYEKATLFTQKIPPLVKEGEASL